MAIAQLRCSSIRMSYLVAVDGKNLRHRYGVVVERTVLELRGYPCANLEQDTQAKQQIICSRSFGERITHMNSMHQALAGYMERAAEKLRAEGMCCRHATLFIRTSPFNDKEPYYGNQVSTKLAVLTILGRCWNRTVHLISEYVH
ncbi:DinB/UmuC family translesion DNA polymerase [Aeromonas caviae]|uniref:DinB/UmuC family translesion DNA polymerase n=1 Tax=Aeromonas caviae TaxID=648 RepID=UPI003872CB5C